jgi:hypothetical protein
LRDNEAICGKIKTPIALMISRIAKEDTPRGSGSELMSSGGRKVGIAGATKNAKMLIGGCGSIESRVGAEGIQSLSGELVKQVCGSVKCLNPKPCRQRGPKQERADDIGGGMNYALSFTVLRESVGARHPQAHAMGEEKRAR